MTAIRLTIPGECVPKARPRMTRYGVYTPPRTKQYERYIQTLLKSHRVPKLEGPLKVTIVINKGIPKSMGKKKQALAIAKQLFPTVKPDLDNYIKAVLDACNGIAFHDDNAICELRAYKIYSHNPRVELVIEQMEGEGKNESCPIDWQTDTRY